MYRNTCLALTALFCFAAVARAEFDTAALRDRGPEGLQYAIDHGAPPQVIDAIAGQRHASVSHLYWYTDLDRAIEVAQTEGKPILSLRMLGKLTDEKSCANSRYFRTTLYANAQVSAMLRERFVLHWQSVRPVPQITIDFGDGRRIERTITGNSAHWVLDSNGRPVDALPGLYASQRFMRLLDMAAQQAQAVATMDTAERMQSLAAWHTQRVAELDEAWQADLLAANLDPNVRDLDDQQWQRIALLHRDEVQFDERVMGLMEQQAPDAGLVMPRAVSKSNVESPMLRMVRRFGQLVAIDTIKNEYNLHRQVHGWFIDGTATQMNVALLNDRLYAEVFLTPASDPWLGMAPPDAFAALDNGGLVSHDISIELP